MHVVLISTYVYPIALGMRYVSAVLKRAGHRVTLLFLNCPPGKPEVEVSPALRDDFLDHCRGADVFGFSLMTNSFHRACHLTRILRNVGARALSGGSIALSKPTVPTHPAPPRLAAPSMPPGCDRRIAAGRPAAGGLSRPVHQPCSTASAAGSSRVAGIGSASASRRARIATRAA